jgi:hypothetical protein
MNYGQLRKMVISLALLCVFAVSLITTGATSAFAQGYYRTYNRHNYGRWERRYDHDGWRRYRRVYVSPWTPYPYGYRYPYPYGYPYPPAGYYHHGRFGPYVYFGFGGYPWW